MIIKYSTGTISKIIDVEDDDKEELEDKLVEAEELSEEDKLTKTAADKKIPFWLAQVKSTK
jgi:hypothetical protein